VTTTATRLSSPSAITINVGLQRKLCGSCGVNTTLPSTLTRLWNFGLKAASKCTPDPGCIERAAACPWQRCDPLSSSPCTAPTEFANSPHSIPNGCGYYGLETEDVTNWLTDFNCH
jgi:hypothetical protein